MNLKALFETQAKLDADILAKHPVQEGEDRLSKKILALQVELGELANEQRSWKFWSNDQKPRTAVPVNTFYGSREGLTRNPLLEEYVDCLHFILSIGLELDREYFRFDEHQLLNPNYKPNDSIVDQFTEVIKYAILLTEDDYCNVLLTAFVALGEMLGFTWEQVEAAYYEKNKINHQRQQSGY
jgi:dimeric dUTPase (all-alpha-NTP-PPase superfamily)